MPLFEKIKKFTDASEAAHRDHVMKCCYRAIFAALFYEMNVYASLWHAGKCA
jgi:hypothetical protein